MIIPTDNLSQQYPVSVKGVILIENKVLLLKNERNEYELPGGKLEIDEQPIDCLKREIKEETNIDVEVNDIIDSWLYHINHDTHVVIITYGCIAINNSLQSIKISNEHKELKMASPQDIGEIVMPENYKGSIANWVHYYKLGERYDSASQYQS